MHKQGISLYENIAGSDFKLILTMSDLNSEIKKSWTQYGIPETGLLPQTIQTNLVVNHILLYIFLYLNLSTEEMHIYISSDLPIEYIVISYLGSLNRLYKM